MTRDEAIDEARRLARLYGLGIVKVTRLVDGAYLWEAIDPRQVLLKPPPPPPED